MDRIILISLIVVNPIEGLSDVPRISAYPCEVPVSERQFSICCKTENIYTSPVFIYKDKFENVIASVQHPCSVTSEKRLHSSNCRRFKETQVIRITTNKTAADSDGVWGCYYYGGVSTYNLTTDKIVTDNSGYHYAQLYHETTMTWTTNGGNYTIILPNGQPLTTLLNYSVTYLSGKVHLNLRNVTKDINGTYVCVSERGIRREAITLIVMESASTPSVYAVKVEFSVQYMTTNLTCLQNTVSAGPPFYEPKFNTSWLYSTTSEYSVQEDGANLIVKNLDCNIKFSRPVFCALKEGPGEWSPYAYLHPHTLCSFKPPAAQPASSNDNTAGQTAGIVIGCLTTIGSVFICVCYFCIKRQRSSDQSCCENCEEFCDVIKECCDESKESCLEKCCSRCRKVEEDYVEPREQDINRSRRTTSEDDLQHILNLYSMEDTPTDTPQQMRREVTGVENPVVPMRAGVTGIDNLVDETENSNNSNNGNDIDRRRGGDEALVESNQATGINKPLLVLELESCLQNLSRRVSTTVNQIQLRRSHIVEDMMNVYADPDILRCRLHVQLIGENGSDLGGLSRDAFTTFWNEALSVFFKGDAVHIPYLPLVNMENENKFVILGRILTHSTAVLGFLPVQISKSSMMVMIYNSTEIEEDSLINDFLLYLDSKDRQIINVATNDFSKLTEEQLERAQELFFRYEMGCVLRPDSFRNQLLKIARNELCVKPRSLCEKIRQGIPDDHFEAFWCHLTVDHIEVLHSRLKPSPAKILSCLQPSVAFGNLTRRQRKVYEFFQEFIEKLSHDDLQLLLQLITGQNCVPKTTIKVEFSDLGGVQRRPIFHTCSYMVELPDSYKNYKDFEQEMTTIMHSDTVLQFSMA